MTWLTHLYETYENNTQAIGRFEKKKNDQEYALLPVSHTTQNAHIEVAVDDKGEFVSAHVVEKQHASTIIPCTEASANRTSAPAPHPLFDKLCYVAGDYREHGGEIKKGNPHADYLMQLQAWCESPHAHPKVQKLYQYLKKGTLIADLVRAHVLHVDEQRQWIDKWNKEWEMKRGEKPNIFQVITQSQSDAFVRFSVHIVGDVEPRLWRDRTVQESFVAYYQEQLDDTELCYVSGEKLPVADKHASRIRHAADKAKLISANDNNGFTFRGRFKQSRDAATVSYEVSQKAHHALKWLIAKQGYTIDEKVFLFWGTEDVHVPDPISDLDFLYEGMKGITDNQADLTHQEFARQVKLALGGYKSKLDYRSNVIIMILDAATTGRLSIVYYRDLNKELFLNRVEQWHQSCTWLHQYKKNEEKQWISFIGAPATRDIAFAAYGPRVNNKVVKDLIERMLPSIIDGRKVPLDILRSAVQRASNPAGFSDWEKSGRWEWEKTLSITCALVNNYEKEDFNVALDVNNTTRDYLFGRLLAVADVLERSALDKEEKRATNAIRYMNAFSQRPARTWQVIQSNIQPYQAKMGSRANIYNRLIDEIGNQIKPEEFHDKALKGLYLLGFYSQRYELYQGGKGKKTISADEINVENQTEGAEENE
ncbi:type I-C CRISPR-associated protein Cas8c/Csd1 [Marinicrinis sediminis]|uniref:Type I-C CRISPR-associated protein Cas8c/Csd1 n=1 Tax=Marinicrinis sediminis TaxID=1652465 RepID=A0ABW5RCD6_9BACL